MVNIFNSPSFNKLLLSDVLIAFSMATLNPSPANAKANIDLNTVAFALRMKDLADKVWKYKSKGDVNKLLDTVLDIKQEIELNSKIKFNITDELDKAEREIKKKCKHVPKKDIELVKKFILKREKKRYHRMLCMASYLQEKNDLTFDEYEIIYRKTHEHDDKEKDDDVKDLPVKLSIGITMILAGGFLCGVGTFLKIPACITYGEALVIGGVNFAIDGYTSKKEEDKNKEKDKK